MKAPARSRAPAGRAALITPRRDPLRGQIARRALEERSGREDWLGLRGCDCPARGLSRYVHEARETIRVVAVARPRSLIHPHTGLGVPTGTGRPFGRVSR